MGGVMTGPKSSYQDFQVNSSAVYDSGSLPATNLSRSISHEAAVKKQQPHDLQPLLHTKIQKKLDATSKPPQNPKTMTLSTTSDNRVVPTSIQSHQLEPPIITSSTPAAIPSRLSNISSLQQLQMTRQRRLKNLNQNQRDGMDINAGTADEEETDDIVVSLVSSKSALQNNWGLDRSRSSVMQNENPYYHSQYQHEIPGKISSKSFQHDTNTSNSNRFNLKTRNNTKKGISSNQTISSNNHAGSSGRNSTHDSILQTPLVDKRTEIDKKQQGSVKFNMQKYIDVFGKKPYVRADQSQNVNDSIMSSQIVGNQQSPKPLRLDEPKLQQLTSEEKRHENLNKKINDSNTKNKRTKNISNDAPQVQELISEIYPINSLDTISNTARKNSLIVGKQSGIHKSEGRPHPMRKQSPIIDLTPQTVSSNGKHPTFKQVKPFSFNQKDTSEPAILEVESSANPYQQPQKQQLISLSKKRSQALQMGSQIAPGKEVKEQRALTISEQFKNNLTKIAAVDKFEQKQGHLGTGSLQAVSRSIPKLVHLTTQQSEQNLELIENNMRIRKTNKDQLLDRPGPSNTNSASVLPHLRMKTQFKMQQVGNSDPASPSGSLKEIKNEKMSTKFQAAKIDENITQVNNSDFLKVGNTINNMSGLQPFNGSGMTSLSIKHSQQLHERKSSADLYLNKSPKSIQNVQKELNNSVGNHKPKEVPNPYYVNLSNEQGGFNKGLSLLTANVTESQGGKIRTSGLQTKLKSEFTTNTSKHNGLGKNFEKNLNQDLQGPFQKNRNHMLKNRKIIGMTSDSADNIDANSSNGSFYQRFLKNNSKTQSELHQLHNNSNDSYNGTFGYINKDLVNSHVHQNHINNSTSSMSKRIKELNISINKYQNTTSQSRSQLLLPLSTTQFTSAQNPNIAAQVVQVTQTANSYENRHKSLGRINVVKNSNGAEGGREKMIGLKDRQDGRGYEPRSNASGQFTLNQSLGQPEIARNMSLVGIGEKKQEQLDSSLRTPLKIKTNESYISRSFAQKGNNLNEPPSQNSPGILKQPLIGQKQPQFGVKRPEAPQQTYTRSSAIISKPQHSKQTKETLIKKADQNSKLSSPPAFVQIKPEDITNFKQQRPQKNQIDDSPNQPNQSFSNKTLKNPAPWDEIGDVGKLGRSLRYGRGQGGSSEGVTEGIGEESTTENRGTKASGQKPKTRNTAQKKMVSFADDYFNNYQNYQIEK